MERERGQWQRYVRPRLVGWQCEGCHIPDTVDEPYVCQVALQLPAPTTPALTAVTQRGSMIRQQYSVRWALNIAADYVIAGRLRSSSLSICSSIQLASLAIRTNTSVIHTHRHRSGSPFVLPPHCHSTRMHVMHHARTAQLNPSRGHSSSSHTPLPLTPVSTTPRPAYCRSTVSLLHPLHLHTALSAARLIR